MTHTPTQRLTHKTKSVIVDMLTENTGTHLCDSGGEDGRGWQQMRKRGLTTVIAMDSRPKAWIDDIYPREGKDTVDNWSIRLDTYHYLVDHCTFDPRMDKLLQKFLTNEETDGYLHGSEDAFQAMVAKASAGVVKDPYGSRFSKLQSHYTYNEENLLSTDIQFCVFSVESRTRSEFDGEYAIIQTHNGADARGGMSTARAFSLDSIDSFLLDYNQASVDCGHGHSWTHRGGDWDFYDYENSRDDSDKARLIKQPLTVLRNPTNPTGYDGHKLLCPICDTTLNAYPYGS